MASLNTSMALKFFGGDNNNSKFNKIDYLDSK
jgi:hypothetical protein